MNEKVSNSDRDNRLWGERAETKVLVSTMSMCVCVCGLDFTHSRLTYDKIASIYLPSDLPPLFFDSLRFGLVWLGLVWLGLV